MTTYKNVPLTALSSANAVPRRRGRPAKSDTGGVVSRDRILQVCASLFHRKGYMGATVRDIADEVGILSGSLFHHFSSKEEMLLEIMREAFISVCVAHEMILAEEREPVVAFRRMLYGELNAMTSDERRDYHAVVYLDWREAPENSHPELQRYRRRYHLCWRRALEACGELGLLRCDPAMAEHILNSALRGVATWFRKDGHFSPEEFGDMIAHLFINEA